MGSWGTAIYSNDTASDVRDACKDIFAFYDVEEGNQKIFECFQEVLDQKWIDDDYASFWYALADWQWKHGLLTEPIKHKTVELLEAYAGIDNWVEAGNIRDVAKRRHVLDGLRAQLQEPQPPLNRPNIMLKKPKHKPGDVIVFQAAVSDGDDTYWRINCLSVPLMYADPQISGSPYEYVPEFNVEGKYMALLCVGVEQVLHSIYIPDVFDEFSVYVWYDCVSDAALTGDTLCRSGFLPFVDLDLKDFNNDTVNYIEWAYRFILLCESFRMNRFFSQIYKLTIPGEVERFEKLFLQKPYSSNVLGLPDLPHTFSSAFAEKLRMELLGKNVDNLLSDQVFNPAFLSPADLEKAFCDFKKMIQEQYDQRLTEITRLPG